jgi:hypothetical protein
MRPAFHDAPVGAVDVTQTEYVLVDVDVADPAEPLVRQPVDDRIRIVDRETEVSQSELVCGRRTRTIGTDRRHELAQLVAPLPSGIRTNANSMLLLSSPMMLSSHSPPEAPVPSRSSPSSKKSQPRLQGPRQQRRCDPSSRHSFGRLPTRTRVARMFGSAKTRAPRHLVCLDGHWWSRTSLQMRLFKGLRCAPRDAPSGHVRARLSMLNEAR